MLEIKAPSDFGAISGKVIFLSGSIEMGTAELWQDKVVKLLSDKPYTVLNPRRDDWDSSWVQDITNRQFREQVEWELSGLTLADVVLVCFDPNTKSPITLLELGLVVGLKKKVIVFCPDGFYRKGNVDILCQRYETVQVNSIEAAVKRL